MTRLLLTFAIAVCSTFCFTEAAEAEVLDTPKEILKAVQTKCSDDKCAGAWVDDEGLKTCDAAVEDSRNFKQQLNNTEKQIVLFQKNEDLYKQSIADAKQETGLLKTQMVDKTKENESLQNDLHKWYRDPFKMGGAGVIVGALVVGILEAVAHH